jgi:RNA polymerase sigma-70 factor (ECF subfamily)
VAGDPQVQLASFDAHRQATLVGRSKSGDKSALGQLYDETFPIVYRWALAATRNRQDAEDLTAETYERALHVLHRFESGDVPITAWLLRIAQNVQREHRNKNGRLRVVNIANLEVDSFPAVETVTLDASLSEVMEDLSPAQREVLQLRLAGLKVREIAAIQGRAEGTVKALQFAAIRNLRRAIRR